MKHMRIHEPQKKFQCEICERRFTQKGALTEHLIVHTNIKAYTCLKCKKSFRHKHGLQNHLKRKFPCDKKRKGEARARGKKLKEPRSESREEVGDSEAEISAELQRQTVNVQFSSLLNSNIPKDQFCDMGKRSNVEVLPVLERVIGSDAHLLRSLEGQSESSVESIQINDRLGHLESFCDTAVDLNDKDSSESEFVSPCLMEDNQESENSELFLQQPQARYVASYQDQTGWIPLNYKLAEL